MESSLENMIEECKKHNKHAQKLLYEKYAPLMNGICLRYLGDMDLVKDIVQEGFIKVFQKINQYTGKGSFEGWIKRILINTTISFIRKHSKKKQPLDIDDIEEPVFSEENDFTGNPQIVTKRYNFQVILSADFSEIELLSVLKRIPENYGIVFNLFCIEHFKHEEIADILDIGASTSRTRLMKARIMIQKELYQMSLRKLNNNCLVSNCG
jgi:RNA polymerase sigma-70 factor, ECF subfamily